MLCTFSVRAGDPVVPADLGKRAGKHAVTFTENKGQVCDQHYRPRPDVLFGGMADGMAFHLRRQGISYQLFSVDSWKDEDTLFLPHAAVSSHRRKRPDQISSFRLDINWLNCNQNSIIIPDIVLPGFANFYLAGCPNGVNRVRTFSGVTYKEIYPGIDLHFYEWEGGLKYDYVVSPFASHGQVKLVVRGARAIGVQPDGGLVIETPLGAIREDPPAVFENGKRLFAKWVVRDSLISFKVMGRNLSEQLIIDPGVRIWGTYFGGTGVFSSEESYSCATDPSGDVYIAGATSGGSGTLIATTGAHQVSFAGANDAVLAKFNPSGLRIWSTYYGGAGQDRGFSCATDLSGNVFLSGQAGAGSTSGIASAGAHQTVYGGGLTDVFLAKFNSSGVRQWGTYYGDDGWNHQDVGGFCTTDVSGNVYLTGTTDATIGIATTGAHQTAFGGSRDAFLVKFNSSGVRQWGTYYGTGNGLSFGGSELGYGCATDVSGNVYMAGTATGNYTGTVITTTGAHQPVLNGTITSGGLLVKFNSNGSRLWATMYLGVRISAVCTDPVGNVFITGWTTSTNGTVIATPGAHQPSLSVSTSTSISDAFLAKFSSAGVRRWGTYYGGNNTDRGESCATDGNGAIYLAGWTNSSNSVAIATPGSQQTTFNGAFDSFLVKLDSSGVRQWGTYYGGIGVDGDLMAGCATFSTGHVYLTSRVSSSSASSLIVTAGTHQTVMAGTQSNDDAYLVKFSDCSPAIAGVATPSPNLVRCSSQTTTLSVSGTGTVTWYGTSSGGSPLTTGSVFVTPPLTSGLVSFYAGLTNVCTSPATLVPITITVNPSATISVNSGSICSGGSFTISPSGAATYTFTGGSSIVSPLFTTSYSVTGTSTAGCSSATPAIVTVTVHQVPVVSVNSGSICSGATFSMIPSGASTYTLSSGSNVVNPVNTTSYSVIGTSSAGCTSTNAAISTVTVHPVPVISVNSGTICKGETFTMVPAGASTYTFSGGSSVIAPFVTTSYSITGTSADGCESHTLAIATVSVMPDPTVVVSSGTICPGGSFTMMPSGAATYSYSSGSNIVMPVTTTSYSVTGTDADGCTSLTPAIVTVTVLPSPVFTINGQDSLCAGQSAILSVSGAASFTWNTGSTAPVLFVQPVVTTSYSVNGESAEGCDGAASFIVEVRASHLPAVPNVTTCSGVEVLLQPSNPDPQAQYTWMPGGQTGPVLSVSPGATTTYTLFSSLDGCPGHTTAVVAVTEKTDPNTEFIYKGPYCSGQAGLTGPVLDPGFFGGGQFSVSPALSINETTGMLNLADATPGIYTVSYSLAAKGCTLGAARAVSLVVAPSTQLQLATRLTIAEGESVVLEASGGSSYEWSPADWLSCSSCASPEARPPHTTTYCVSDAASQCALPACVVVVVDDLPCSPGKLTVPNAFTPNHDGNNDFLVFDGWAGCATSFNIIIYDRWGEKVFESSDAEFRWDGSFRGKMIESEVLVFVLEVRLHDGTPVARKGNITLVR